MLTSEKVGRTAPLALLGGALWTSVVIIMALRAPGEAGGNHRDTADLDPLLLISMLLILVGLAGLHVQQARNAGWIGKWGFYVTLTGAALFFTGHAGSALGIKDAWQLVVMPGLLLMVIGSMLFGGAIMQAHVFSRRTGQLLMIAALALIGFNTEDARAWMAVPFGLAWIALGWELWHLEAKRYRLSMRMPRRVSG